MHQEPSLVISEFFFFTDQQRQRHEKLSNEIQIALSKKDIIIGTCLIYKEQVFIR